ncbi:MAG: hypothetical protein A3C06_01165 [Candidatus Taylorbacteria bacterium RIFCSPHIGHO2_02_FULL_46_13]|uniref:Uncharacterized protein n=1 Tax=Candidatus Taylorbacteria bacterium RIFCSPHIGHO2_02_FULL_46_13 TaxID=1802312 RepID=A0A1G2MVI0_9BACT|nr:MAG: hypothetical protein A3C06_01165 [Candidatus Taylorbacteria bacterium RIFCSPHIGHO2_02_FULL_46_13]
MKYTPIQYAKTLYELVEADPKHDKETVKKFAQTLVAHGKTSQLRAILAEFERQWYIQKGITPVEVTSTRTGQVKAKTLKELVGTEIELIEKIDSTVGEGARITIGDWRIDNTVQRRMNELKQAVQR